VTKKEILKCGNSPCSSCPYKRDTPPGIWAEHEYEKLPAYDGSTLEQFANGAVGVFLCHAQPGRLCAGWVGTHDMSENFALRIAALDPNVEIDPMVYDYQSPQPLYGSGAEAAAVGLAGVAQPSREAKARVEKLLRKHKRLREPKGEGKRNAST
jgi:hypothetical protein